MTQFNYSVRVTAKVGLLTLLALLGALFVLLWARAERRRPRAPAAEAAPALPATWRRRTGVLLVIGAITDFLDTLGIGSFATTTSLFKLGRVVDDEDIPGTMNVGHALPTLAEAFIYIRLVEVDMQTLLAMIAAAVAGSYLGAGIVARWRRRRIQVAMGLLLLVAAAVIVLRQRGLVPGDGNALGVSGARLWIGVAGNFVLGALMTLGIGLFAPCMILVSLLGMNPETAFPIMMGSCAFLMPVAGLRFIRSGRYDRRAAVGLAVGGVPAVLVAAFLVTSLPLGAVKWLVVVVVVYTAAAMLSSARQPRTVTGGSTPPPPADDSALLEPAPLDERSPR